MQYKAASLLILAFLFSIANVAVSLPRNKATTTKNSRSNDTPNDGVLKSIDLQSLSSGSVHSARKDTADYYDNNPALQKRAPDPVAEYTVAEFRTFLERLDAKLMSQTIVIAHGGYPCVNVLHSRPKTHDIDFILHYDTPSFTQTLSTLQMHIAAVASEMSIAADWMNSDGGGFLGADLFTVSRRAVTQGILLFPGTYLKVYAAEWKSQLIGKLNRITNWEMQLEFSRPRDASDAAAMLTQFPQPRNRAWLRRLRALAPNECSVADITQYGVPKVNEAYAQMYYGQIGIDLSS